MAAMSANPGAGGKRGMFFTLSALLLCAAILLFSLPLSGQYGRNGRVVSSMIDMDKTSAAYAAAEGQIRKISAAAYDIRANNDTVSINESFPRPGIAGGLANFAEFEQAYSELNVSMNLSDIMNGTFEISPNGAMITHLPDRTDVVPSGSGAFAPKSYDVELDFAAGEADGAQWDILAQNTSAGGLTVHVRIQDSTYSLYQDFVETLDMNGTSRINITNGGALVGYVQFSGQGALEVYCAGNSNLKALVGFRNPVHVLASDTLSVAGGANKTSYIRIA